MNGTHGSRKSGNREVGKAENSIERARGRTFNHGIPGKHGRRVDFCLNGGNELQSMAAAMRHWKPQFHHSPSLPLETVLKHWIKVQIQYTHRRKSGKREIGKAENAETTEYPENTDAGWISA